MRAIGIADSGDRSLAPVDCLVAERWIVTLRDHPIEVVEGFRRLTEGSGELGRLDGLEFPP